MGFDRTRFSAPKLETNRKVSESVNKTMKVGDSNRGDYHKIDEGMNVFRLFPPHNDNEPTFQPKVVYWIECKVAKTDSEGKAIKDSFEWVRRPIFDSRIHGGTEKDIIDEYIKFTKNAVFGSTDKTEDAKKMVAPINGWKDKSGKWNAGILPSTSFVAYATKGEIKIANIGRLELFQRDKDELEKLNVDDTTGEVLSTDIWSGPDDGVQFTLNRVKDDKGKWVNVIARKQFTPKGKGADVAKEWEEFVNSQIIPDDVLEHWSKMEPLSTQFKNAYKRADFLRAVEALQKFDKDNGYHTFDNDEFLAILQEVDGYYPEEENGSAPEAPENKEMSQSSVAEDTGALDYSEMSREELKAIIKKNGLEIRVLKSMETEVLAKKVEEAMLARTENVAEEEEEEEEDDNAPEPEDSASETESESEKLPWEKEAPAEDPAPSSTASAASALRERLARMNRK